jgi:hypothetical protein
VAFDFVELKSAPCAAHQMTLMLIARDQDLWAEGDLASGRIGKVGFRLGDKLREWPPILQRLARRASLSLGRFQGGLLAGCRWLRPLGRSELWFAFHDGALG